MLHGSTPARMRGAAGMMLASAALLTLSPSVLAFHQSGTAPANAGDASSYWAVVTGNGVNLRSGPSAQSAYAFGKLRQGDLVRVVKEDYGWARVQTQGTAFGDVIAFVPADRRVSVSADGTTATVNARTELRAPNVDAGSSPDKSWKQIGAVDAGTTLTVVGTAEGEKESVLKVKVPASAEAWVNLTFLRRASEAESASATNAVATAASAAAPAATPDPAAPSVPVVPAADASTAVSPPVNTEPAGAAAPTAAAPEVAANTGVSPTSGGGIESISSPVIPPLLGEQPKNASVVAAETPAAQASEEPTRAAKPKFVSRRATLDDLESQFKAVRAQAQADAEFEALRAKYEELASANDAYGSVKGMADARARQLTLLIETQVQVQELERKKASADTNRKGIAELILNIQRRADYTAIGVLNASAVYDGSRLPELYRVCDPTTGATIAYVEPNPDIPMATMVGTLIGVRGGKSFDPALRLTVISPLSMELLTMRETPQVIKTDSTRPIEAAGTLTPAQSAQEPQPCPEDFSPAPAATP